MYEINYIDRRKNNHKIKIAVASWQSAVGSRHPPLRLRIYKYTVVLTACIGGRGVCEKVAPVVKWAVVITDIIYIMLINMLVDFYHFLLFSFSLFYTYEFVIHYFQFVNFTHHFSLPIHPQEALKNWSIQCKPLPCRRNAR